MADSISKRLLITHVDLDGISAGLFGKLCGRYDKVIYRDYGFTKPKPSDDAARVKEIEDDLKLILSFDEIDIADLSISEEEFIEWSKDHVLRCFDHHEPSQYIENYPGCVHDMTRSGALIFFDEVYKKIVPRYPAVMAEYAALVDIYDRWVSEHPLFERALDLNRVMMKYRVWRASTFEDSIRDFVIAFTTKLRTCNHLTYTLTEQRYIEESKEREDQEYITAVKACQLRVDSHGRVFSIFAAGAKISMTAYTFLKKHPFVDYMVIINSFKGINGKISGRTRPSAPFKVIDLFPLRGHADAAGSHSTVETAECLLRKMCALPTWEETGIIPCEREGLSALEYLTPATEYVPKRK